jgi:IS1 family transposase
VFIVKRSNRVKRGLCAVSYTDFWSAYETVFPANQNRAVGKETGQTNHVELKKVLLDNVFQN